jgi:tetratricopeptide (TPR) repeat protein
MVYCLIYEHRFQQIVCIVMKRLKIYIIVGLLFFTAFSEIGWAVENYISPATIPPSKRREGLVQSPSQLNTSGNLLVTGNITGGGYFRGVVPYSAPTDFSQVLPSSSLDSFLRDSVGTEDIGRNNLYSGYRPYYSPTQTVANTMPGGSIITAAPTTSLGAYSIQSYLSGTVPVRRDEILNPESALSLARLRPMSMTPADMEKLISSEIAKSSPARLTDQLYQPQAEQFKGEASPESYKTAEPNKILSILENTLLPPAVKKPDSNLPEVGRLFETPTQSQQQIEKSAGMLLNVPEELDLKKQLDVYDRMKQQLVSLQKKIESALTEEQTGIAHLGEESQSQAAGSSALQGVQTPAGSALTQSTALSPTGEGGEISAQEQTQITLPGYSKTEKLADTYLSATRTKDILGPYETFASYSEDKFNQNMRAGEMYLKQGKFYRAADAYTLASLYKPDDPLAYAGKSHALFAAGEYMSSALFLSRCLQIFPGYAKFKIDIVSMVGSRDLLESRVVDVEECLKRSGAPELQFLLAYVYYQLDRLKPAQEAIDAAYKMMPQAPAVLALKKAIEDSAAADKDSSQRITDDASRK